MLGLIRQWFLEEDFAFVCALAKALRESIESRGEAKDTKPSLQKPKKGEPGKNVQKTSKKTAATTKLDGERAVCAF
jgi:hypothetical protein